MVDSKNKTQALPTDVPGLNVENRALSSGKKSSSLPPAGRRRLAVTRGFDNRGLLRISRTNPVTPAGSSEFLPVAGSTPLNSPQKNKSRKFLGISSLFSAFSNKVTDKHVTSSSIPQRSCNVLPSSSVTKPVEFVRKSVITPVSTPEGSLDWDNYVEVPSYSLSGDQFVQGLHSAGQSCEENLLADFRHSLAPSSESSLSPVPDLSMSRFKELPINMDSATRDRLQNEMNKESAKLMSMQQVLLDLMDDFTVEDVSVGNIDQVEGRLKEISESRSTFRNAVRQYKELYGEFGDRENRLDSYLASANNLVREHARRVWERVGQLRPPMIQYEKESLSLQKEQFLQQQKFQQEQFSQLQQQQVSNRGELVSAERQETGIRNCEGKRLLFRDELRFLTESLCLPDYGSIDDHWMDQSETDIRKAMRKVGFWEKSLVSLSKTFREYQMLSKQYKNENEELENDVTDYIEIRNKVKEVVLAVQSEDERRNLQTLESAKTDKVTYPTFSGEAGEDLMRFREKIKECFKKNRVPESDQLYKLRENLRGIALKRVPVTLKSLATAWQNLEDAFGSPLIVLRERLKSLTKLGGIPSDSLPVKQIVWFHDFEAVLQDILDLGDSDDLNMQMGAYGPSVQEQILKAFSDNPVKKQEIAMAGSSKQPKQKLLAYKEKVIEYRKRTQLAEVESGSVVAKSASKSPSNGSAHISFPGPKKNDNCRVCLHMQSQNNQSANLVEKHLGTLPIHCPKFIAMKMSERRKFAIKAKFCIYCLHPDVEFSPEHGKSCKEAKRKTKSSFTCISPNCSCHFWLCSNHSEDNKSKLKDAAKNLERHGLRLAFHGTISISANSAYVQSASCSLESQVDKELLPVPTGQPIFMFFGARGKTRSLMTFFDNDCSRFIMREFIPNKELPASLVKAGPIPIGGVGGMTVFASGEYLVAMDTIEGKAQQLQGVTVPVITGDFPLLNISEAVSAVKSADRKNTKLRNCKFPPQVGGVVDCLIGIQYNQLQPKVVHMLPSGLAIYETKLAPYSKGMNYVLGGPHSSFDVLLAKSGNAAYLLKEFVAGFTTFRSSGPPSLTQFFMSDFEVAEAVDRNFRDGEIADYKKLIQLEDDEVSTCLDEFDPAHCKNTCDSHEYVDTEPVDLSELSGMLDQYQLVSCIDCGVAPLDYEALYEVEKLSRLKHLLDKQEHGIDISYRCIRCRNCLDCKNSEKVDKISLREESELYEIKKSVTLDWQNSKIVCSLPLRGKERDFLCSNEDRALRVLESQCRKYYKDEETRSAIVTAFNKLIEKKYIVFLEHIPPDVIARFKNKEVQYYLPWRIQFKPGSASTNTRPVFDASSGTRRRSDGSGGRCLNDIVCKGPIDTLDLLRVMLRFMIGPYAMAADLTKMYNQFSLVPDHWNLQRILFKENLNPDAVTKQACVTTLIYGVKSVAGQTEFAFEEIADKVKNENPKVSQLLTLGRYCDNLLNSTVTLHEAETLASDTTEILDRLGLPTKGFSFSGKNPQPLETLDGISIDVNGMRWCTAVDSIEVKVPSLHFG